jgi:hypothetical protein
MPPPRAGTSAIPTGISALDRLLSGGGLPSGRLTELVGRRGSGRTTLVRQLVATAVAARRWVAVVDGARSLAPRDWAAIADSGRLWVVRPPAPDRGAWCADILLRSGAFSMVVLDNVLPLPRQVAVRLTRLAREHDVTLVVTGEDSGSTVGSAVRIRIGKRPQATGRRPQEPGAGGWKPGNQRRLAIPGSRFPVPAVLQLTVDKGGSHHSVEVCCAIDVARRLCAHPEVPDRRGVAPRNRQGERVDSPHRAPRAGGSEQGSEPAGIGQRDQRERDERDQRERDERAPVTGGTLPRKRRCAEPLVRHDGFLLTNGPEAGCGRRGQRVS